MSKSPQFDAISDLLRADDWMPRKPHPCGCNRDRLCEGHSVLRAVEHYHPETKR